MRYYTETELFLSEQYIERDRLDISWEMKMENEVVE